METDRLLFREQTKAVLTDLLSKSKDAQLQFFGVNEESDLQEELEKVQNKLASNCSNWKKWDLIKKDSFEVIGSCVFHNWSEEHERAEIGYNLHPAYQSQGYMTEALVELIKYGFESMQLNRIEACIHPENSNSIKLIKKLGFQKEGLLRKHYKHKGEIYDSLMFALLK